jgi:hypothetical protein
MLIKSVMTAAAISALSIGAAHAQSAGMNQPATVSGAVTDTPPAARTTVTSDGATTTISTTATAATSMGQQASVTSSLVTNGPVPDTAENRAKYGQPDSNAGKRTSAKGN